MDQTTTRVPAVVDALFARLTTALDGWQGFDGPPFGTLELDFFSVGFPDFDGAAITADVERTQGMGHRYSEVFEIRCLLSSQNGDEDIKAARDRCHAGLAAVETALQEDRGLGGAADLVNFGPAMQWAQMQTEGGATVEVAFYVQGRVTR